VIPPPLPVDVTPPVPPDEAWAPCPATQALEVLEDVLFAKAYELQEAIFDQVDVVGGMIGSAFSRRRDKITPAAEEPAPEREPTSDATAVTEPLNVEAAPPAAAPPKKKKKTQAERMAELSAPRIRDERIKPGMHVYKPPVRGLAYRGTEKMAMYQERRDGGMTYKHREQNEDGEIKLRMRETQGNEKVVLADGEVKGVAKQRAIEKATGIRTKANSTVSAASKCASSTVSAASQCASSAGPSAPKSPQRRPGAQLSSHGHTGTRSK